MDNLILKLIAFYQRIISPRKGYRCAYSVLHHTQGCSGAVKDIIHNKGVVDGWREIRQRFADCRVAAETLQQQKLAANPAGKKRRKPGRKRDACDGCDVVTGCDGKCCSHLVPDNLPDLDCPCDCLSVRLWRRNNR
ncbi:membrane protein insertion efficiency factor YidD [Klebsiella aerogenes]|uniref:membrane protein insertion efficiency factor YidD n=1 Tax=Klebsiella aerogenes TaxID=548 RepID=UPI0009407B8E|nr:membrane protein insertion efficiency factor YidD [Klebsiella aerogenes]EKU6608370.1 membrane protein insertion efficiency factor YidD [Klebsiella aerogenes]EKW5855296.1 membrane protein insertion efficiency factor YidD [Klebsiella aerogenes]EKZ5853195.1 membrane protein insertion efficiency factor YidD [Klebsiella aerogenes]EKZ6548054.1 membrane protein insertion efficiency factor YidD [Klebsiella aerogenes]EKZ6674496.1 membrane protein insertion efficiency factor YidD [Klebsiella aerogene